MARNAIASSSKAPIRPKQKLSKKPEPESEPESDEEYDEAELDLEPELGAEEGIAQYAPDDWNGEDDDASHSGSGSDEGSDQSISGSDGDSGDEGADDLRKLQANLRSMPLATLIKAQKSFKSRPNQDSDSDEDSDLESGSEAGPSTSKAGTESMREKRLAEAKARLAEMQRRKGKAGGVSAKFDDLEDEDGSEDEFADMRRDKGGEEWERERKEKPKRDNKHAPTAMSTKKQVSRMRQVVESTGKSDRRDPRFDTMSSTAVDPHLQSQSYSFIPKLLKDELSGLRTAVQMASKAEKNCPLSQKPARTAEREMLEMELGRLRTKIERGEREAKERDVLARAKKEENEKRKEGKGAWYMKRNEQKDLLLKARFENLEQKGGQRAVKKALEKKRKKTASKEKKSRPFARGSNGAAGGSGGPGGEKRRRVA